jgi:hypothetical protein
MLPFTQWRAGVLGFIEIVEAFYSQSEPKNELVDPIEREGWRRFWREWSSRKRAHSS